MLLVIVSSFETAADDGSSAARWRRWNGHQKADQRKRLTWLVVSGVGKKRRSVLNPRPWSKPSASAPMPDEKPLSQEAVSFRSRRKIAFRIARTLKTMVAITAIIPIT